jgi:sulfhydrogenase subunit beta (sulfur reductase)
MGYLLPKSQLLEFLGLMMNGSSFVAPVKRKKDKVVVFEQLDGKEDLARLDFTTNPQFTAKKYFMPAYEELFDYDITNQKITDHKLNFKQHILFGLRLCDLNAVKIQDELFINKQFTDDQYKAARDSIFLIGWYCNKPPSKWCFCESMELSNYYDLMMRDLPNDKKHIYIDVGTPKGELLMRKAKKLKLKEHTESIPKIKTPKKLNTKDIRKHFDHPDWEKVANEKCLSCQRCTTMCPTCMCFDIYDKTNADLKTGTRERTWDSCHSKQFSRVAGDHYFRPDRVSRFKHRIYHKVVYYPEVFGTPMCTGCGRCIEHCPTQIDFVDVINKIEERENNG